MTRPVNLDEEPRATINPYLAAGGLVLKRLLWDLHPYSWISRKKIRSWKERFRGQKALILCNGPSLNAVDFGALKQQGIFTFGLNKINLLFSRTDFRPSVIVAVNSHVIEQNADFYNQTDLPVFLDANARKAIAFRHNICFMHSSNIKQKFARDCSMSVCQGSTVTYVAMQLAFYMGFVNVALVGCDHCFDTKGPANMTAIAGQQDVNHFSRDYFSMGATWQLPDIIGSELHYDLARDTFDRYGRKIVNCTEGGRLEIFERQRLSEFLLT